MVQVMSRLFPFVLTASVGLCAVSDGLAAYARSGGFQDWATIHNERFGFQIAYPADILFPTRSPAGNDGRVLKSSDGKAKMLVATFDNAENLSLTAYRNFLLSDIYAKARLDYQPLKARWFVLSGVRGNETFYERVTFSCGGRLINSWAIVYPTAQSQLYNRVVEAVAGTFTVGAGADGTCGEREPPRKKVSTATRRR
jgi:hypothetical protein